MTGDLTASLPSFFSLSMWQATNHMSCSLSFFLFHLIFSFFKDYNRKRQRSDLCSFFLLWSRGGSYDNTTQKWVITNILKGNSTYINVNWEKPLLSLTQSWILPFLVTVHRVCAEESIVGICHMRASLSVRKTPQHFLSVISFFF